MKHYEFPEIVLLPCEAEDVISTSGGVDVWDLPIDPNSPSAKTIFDQ